MPMLHIPSSRYGKAEDHIITVRANEPGNNPAAGAKPVGTSVYGLVVICSCQWQALARDQSEANFYELSHKKANGIF